MNYPDNWQYLSIKECCSVVSGSTPKRNRPEYWDGKIDWVTPKDLSNLNIPVLKEAPEKITELGYKSCSTTLLPEGSILFSSRAPIGLIAIAGKEMCTNQGFKSLVPNASIDSAYLYWCIRNFTPQLSAQGSGTTFKELSKTIVEKFKIPFPPLEEQKRIAAILDKADAIRRKRKEAIALTEELLRSTFLDMFGDPVTNPKSWEKRYLDEFSLIQSGIAKGKKVVDASKAISIPYIRVANVQDGYLNLSEIKELEILQKDIGRYLLQDGDLLLTEGGDPDKLGRGAIWHGQIERCIHQNHIFAVRPRQNIAEPEYLSALVGSDYGKRYFLRAAKQTTGIATINKTQLKRFSAILPPIAIQRKYTQFVQSLNSTMKSYSEIQDYTETLFNSLLQKAFRAEL